MQSENIQPTLSFMFYLGYIKPCNQRAGLHCKPTAFNFTQVSFPHCKLFNFTNLKAKFFRALPLITKF
uniref:Uncharacterized protein n=1 Tax=Anguilla anguilla TaxID=7936 RepID=A0A0E9SG80_ANGAN